MPAGITPGESSPSLAPQNPAGRWNKFDFDGGRLLIHVSEAVTWITARHLG